MRGICALLVCLFHFKANGPIATAEFIRGSWMFVDFFFVLSGFVIAANYRQRLTAGNYMRAFAILRFGRVYPLHLVILGAFIAVEVAGYQFAPGSTLTRSLFDEHHAIAAILTNLTLTQAFGLHDVLTWNQPSWSIAVEFWTYLLFAAAAFRAGENLEKWLVATILVSIATLLLVTPNGINLTYSWSMVRCIYGFAAGAIAWRLWQQSGLTPTTHYQGATLFEIAMAAAVVCFVMVAGGAPADLLGPLVFSAAVLIFARAGGSVSRWLLARELKK